MSGMLSRIIPQNVQATDKVAAGAIDGLSREVKELLNKWGWKTATPLAIAAAEEVIATRSMRSGEFLVSRGHFTDERLSELLSDQPKDTRTLEYIQNVEPQTALDADRYMAACTEAPFYPLAEMEVLSKISPEVIAELDRYDALLVLTEPEGTLALVFATYTQLSRFRSQGRGEVLNSAIYQEVVNLHGGELHVALSHPLSVAKALRELQSSDENTTGVGRYANEWVVSKTATNISPVEKDLARLLDYCLAEEINDISLMPARNGGYEVAVRRYGDLVTPEGLSSYSPEMASSIKRFLMTQSGANPTQATRISEPRDGSIAYRSSVGACFLRCSFIPTNHRGDLNNSMSISLRVLPQTSKPIEVKALGLPEQVIKDLSLAMRLTSGLIIVVGPTNSGKSTTIAGAINEHVNIFGEKRKRLSLEDPIERHIAGVIQFEPSAKEGQAGRLEQMLRAFKRHDPDMIWVGEIRDMETAEICVDSASSGHVVVSTLHANDTVSGIDLLGRLVPETKAFQLIEAVSLVISQRLIKTVCPHCSERTPSTEEEQWLFDSYLARMGEKATLPETVVRANKDGCNECRNGYNGQLPICESLPMTRQARDDTMDMVVQRQAKHAEVARHRSLTLLDSVMTLLHEGRVELGSVLT
ncbi:ATPase, T2SS/T4P/T4SS family [Vreelandella rituensis]|uniref:Bacterial type II secretion system protein E domain-containing protein n=1 Tax=Vreelandella rituensis TaxID=2282306 RepID=A0A368UA63_9GAMM|nr:ATPase, T2SS/T4P/T4SS family [Halomonas rituensis]RCV93871.1 hypothetical protein DU506_01555 [Halomonas rituensis]